MPENPSPNLLGTLLQKASSIGDGSRTRPVPISTFENQQPDPVLSIFGDADNVLGNASLAGLPPLGADSDAALVLSNFLNKTKLGKLNPRSFLRDSKVTGMLVPEAGKIVPPEGFEGPAKAISRSPLLDQKRTLQQEILKRVAENPAPEAMPVLSRRSRQTAVQRSNNLAKGSRSVLNEDMVRDIKRMRLAGKNQNDIFAKYPDIKKVTIQGVLSGQSWNSVKP